MPEQILHWSKEWADLVGGDGPVITDLLGRIAPAFTDDDADRFKGATFTRHGTCRAEVDRGCKAAWDLADPNGLRTTLACAHQTADRVIDTLAPYDPSSGVNDRWHRWCYTRRALHGAVTALVVRRFAPPGLVETLSGVWCDVVGQLPDHVELDTEVPGRRCHECGTPSGVRVVTEAAAAEAARRAYDVNVWNAEQAKRAAERATRMLAEHGRTHLSRDDVRELVRMELAATPGLSVKARAHLERRFAITNSEHAHVPADFEQVSLFGVVAQ